MRRPQRIVAAWLAAWTVAILAPGAQADPAATGAQAFAPCGACHTVTEGGGPLIGPNLWGVVGRAVASVAAFDYSPEFKALGGTWTPERLDQFLANPLGYVPGTRMGYAGVVDPAERAALIAYLSTLRQGGGAAVAQPAQDFGPNWPAGPGQAETGVLCNSCHSLAIVKQQRLSRETWDKLLTWMVEKQGMAQQTPEQRQLILDYLVQHFGPP
jgi:cytochrome c